MEATVVSVLRKWDTYYGIYLVTAKVQCPYCGGTSLHGFGDRTKIVEEYRGCDTCRLTYSVSFICTY